MVSYFKCQSCGNTSTSILSPFKIQPKGIKIKLTIKSKHDFNRTIITTPYTTIEIPKLEFFVSPTREGQISTLGLLFKKYKEDILTNRLDFLKPEDNAGKCIAEFVENLTKLMNLEEEFVVEILDFAGDCKIEGDEDENVEIEEFRRTFYQDSVLGLSYRFCDLTVHEKEMVLPEVSLRGIAQKLKSNQIKNIVIVCGAGISTS